MLLNFDEHHTYEDDKIILTARLVVAPLLPVRMTLDTGASMSTMHHSWLPFLGIQDVRSGEAGSIEVAGGQIAACWLHRVEVVLLDRQVGIEVAFCPTWEMKDLLGMRGFMDRMVFAVDHAEHTLHVQWR